MDALFPVASAGAGVVLVAASLLALRSFGPRLRVGRLLAVTPRVAVADARSLAEAGVRRYVGVEGRIESDEEFEDRDHRPLVLRRTRLEAREATGWRTVEDRREQVPFEVREGLDAIAIDATALDEGLVVVPRESTGVGAELGPRRPAAVVADTPVRVRLQQVSSVEHAVALGVPVRDAGGVRLTAGLGRPLVLTTLERREAMRVLAEGRTALPRAAAVGLVGGLALIAASVVWLLARWLG